MKRRKTLPGRISLLDLPASVPTASAPTLSSDQVTEAQARESEPGTPEIAVVEQSYMKNGALIIPPSPVDASNKDWFCVCHPDGSYRDALAVLYGVEYRKGKLTAIICPALQQRWEMETDYCKDCLIPFYRAARDYAADTLGCSPEDLEGLTYVTIAWRGEERPILRDVPHLGATRARRNREEGKEVANG